MKKTRREMSGPKPAINYKNRATTEAVTKRKPFKGFAGVRKSDAVLLGTSTEDVQNTATEINEVSETPVIETTAKANNPSTETSTVNNDLSEVVVVEETVETAETTTTAEINTATTTVDFVPTMDNTKKEIVDHATSLGIDVKGWWGKQKILDAIQS